MTKTKMIIAAAVVCIFVGVLAAWFSSRTTVQDFSEEIEQAQTNTNSDIPDTSAAPQSFTPPVADKLIIDGVTLRNFYKTERSRSAGNIVFYENVNYKFSYIIDENRFIISVTTSDFENLRTFAEQDFLSNLEITEEQACKLNVSVQNPSIFNPDSDDQVHRLSFCI